MSETQTRVTPVPPTGSDAFRAEAAAKQEIYAAGRRAHTAAFLAIPSPATATTLPSQAQRDAARGSVSASQVPAEGQRHVEVKAMRATV